MESVLEVEPSVYPCLLQNLCQDLDDIDLSHFFDIPRIAGQYYPRAWKNFFDFSDRIRNDIFSVIIEILKDKIKLPVRIFVKALDEAIFNRKFIAVENIDFFLETFGSKFNALDKTLLYTFVHHDIIFVNKGSQVDLTPVRHLVESHKWLISNPQTLVKGLESRSDQLCSEVAALLREGFNLDAEDEGEVGFEGFERTGADDRS